MGSKWFIIIVEIFINILSGNKPIFIALLGLTISVSYSRRIWTTRQHYIYYKSHISRTSQKYRRRPSPLSSSHQLLLYCIRKLFLFLSDRWFSFSTFSTGLKTSFMKSGGDWCGCFLSSTLYCILTHWIERRTQRENYRQKVHSTNLGKYAVGFD